MNKLSLAAPAIAAALFVLAAGPTSASAANDDALLWAGCGVAKKAFMAEIAAAFEAKTGTHIRLEGGGATRGIRDTAARKIDMGGTCRMPLPLVDPTEGSIVTHAVAWDALVVIVHNDNPVKDITTEQMKAICLGQITNWKDLGGDDAPIRLYAREDKVSGVGYAIRQYLFQDENVEFEAEHMVASSGPLEKAVETDPLATGITGVSSAHKRNVNMLALDGTYPSYENVRAGNYGLYRLMYLVTPPSPSPKVKAFVEFATSEDGRKVLRANGTVPYRDGLNLMSKLTIYGFGVK